MGGTSATNTLDCNEMGKICFDDEECEGFTTESLQGPCCIGECKQKTNSDFKFLLGVLLIFVLAGISAYFYMKIKKKQKPKSTEEILKERANKYEERSGKEVKGSLGRV